MKNTSVNITFVGACTETSTAEAAGVTDLFIALDVPGKKNAAIEEITTNFSVKVKMT